MLVPLAAAAQILEIEAESVRHLAESGRLRWVWNVGSRPGRLQLRFWLPELLGRPVADARPENVVQEVIGHPFERRLRSRTVCNLLFIARPHLQRLHVTGELPLRHEAGVSWVLRDDLAKFLKHRLLT